MNTHLKNTGLLFILCATAALGIVTLFGQLYRTQTVFYSHGLTVPAQEWNKEQPIPFHTARAGKFYYETDRQSPLMVPDAAEGNPRMIETELPQCSSGYSLLLVMERYLRKTPPVLSIELDRQSIARMNLVKAPISESPPYLIEVPIEKCRTREGPIQLQVKSTGGPWSGNILLIPHLQLRKWAGVLYPGLTALAILCLWVLLKNKPRTRYVGILLLLFPLFALHLFFVRLYPVALLSGDGKEIIDAIRTLSFTSDMQKHPLFLLLPGGPLRYLWSWWGEPLRVTSLFFTTVAVANIAIAAAILARLFKSETLRLTLLLVYIFSSSIYTVSAVYETYLVTTVLVNLAFLAMLRFRERESMGRAAAWVLSSALLPLASPQLLAFLPSLSVWPNWLKEAGRRKSVLRSVMMLGGMLAVSGLLLSLILTVYGGGLASGADRNMQALQSTHEQYASLDNLHPSQLLQSFRRVMVSSFADADQLPAIGGAKPPRSLSCLAHVLGYLSTGVMCLIFALSVAGLMKGRKAVRLQYLPLTLSVMIYILFHCYLNPGELLLYLPPVMLFLLIGVVKLVLCAVGEKRTIALFVLVAILEVLSITVVAGRLSSGLWDAEGKEGFPIIDLQASAVGTKRP